MNRAPHLSITFENSTEPTTEMTQAGTTMYNDNMIEAHESQAHVCGTYAFQPVVHDGMDDGFA